MRNRLLHSVAFAIVALFAVTVADYLILAQVGVRLLPLDYETLEVAFFVLGALSVVVGLLVYRRPQEAREGFFRWELAWHRLVLAFCLAPIVLTLVGFFGALSWFFDLFANFRLQYAGSLIVGAVVLVVLRQLRWASLVLAFAVLNLGAMTPQLVKWRTAEAGGGTKLRFVLANVNVKNQYHQALVSFLHQADPDVIVLAEINQEWVDGIRSLREEYPYSVVVPLEGYFGIGVWSRLPIVSGETVYFTEEKIPSIVATLDAPGGELLLVGAHAMPPINALSAGVRARMLGALSERTRTASSNVVVLADLNTTPRGYAFRSLLRSSGLKDASRGQGVRWTWPARIWPLAIPIDHALVSEQVYVLGLETGPNIGSDHYPLVLDAVFSF